MTAYYNEHDPYAAQWLRNLVAAGHIAGGDVDERSIVDVRPDDLRAYRQCHFFAGIGGWSYALRLAGWDNARPVWTGSCPCQPFSMAGQGKAANDRRHLWPAWFSLVRECRPAVVFGEQVEAAIGWGWLDLVLTDLEAEGYACGAAVLPACSVGAPHVRSRIWWVGDAARGDLRGHGGGRVEAQGGFAVRSIGDAPGASGATGELADADSHRGSARTPQPGRQARSDVAGGPEGLGDVASKQMGRAGQPWQDCAWVDCADGKARPTQPSLFPLAHGVPGRVGRLRAYGNAIVPQVAAEFITAAQ